MKKLIVSFNENIPLTLPSKSKEKAKEILNSNTKFVELNPEDYFLLKYLDLLAKLKNIKIIYKVNKEKNEELYYDDFYKVPLIKKIIDIFEDLYKLDCKVLKEEVNHGKN